MEDQPATHARLARIEEIQSDTSRRLYAVETKSAVDEVYRKGVETRLEAIEDTLKWLVRLILGAIFLAIISFIVSGGLNVAVG